MSSSSKPAAFTAAGIATAGPTPMMAGSTPTAVNVLHGKNRFYMGKIKNPLIYSHHRLLYTEMQQNRQ